MQADNWNVTAHMSAELKASKMMDWEELLFKYGPMVGWVMLPSMLYTPRISSNRRRERYEDI
jgi:hypothetical protein